MKDFGSTFLVLANEHAVFHLAAYEMNNLNAERHPVFFLAPKVNYERFRHSKQFFKIAIEPVLCF